MPATVLRHQVPGPVPSVYTVRRRLAEAKLRSRRPRKRPRLTTSHVSNRMRWAMAHSHWRERQWRRVIWTDESRFKLMRTDNRIRVWREPNQEWLKENVTETLTAGGGSIMVWAGINYSGRTNLVICKNVTGTVYKDILQNHLLPFAHQSLGESSNLLLMDDNATPHRCRVVKDFKDGMGIRTLRWPSKSPDLDPIENLWNILKTRVARRNPMNLEELRALLIEEWDGLPESLLHNLADSETRRVRALLLANGSHIRY